MSYSSLDDYTRSRKTFRFLPMLCLLTLFLTLSTSAASADTLRVIVMFKDDTPTWVQQKLIKQSSGKIVTWFPIVNAMVLELPAGQLLGKVTSLTNHLGLEIEALEVDFYISHHPPGYVPKPLVVLSKRLGLDIEALEPNFYISPHPPSYVPKPLVVPAQPLPLEGGYRWNSRQIALDKVDWQVQGQGVHVAVLDTGIDAPRPRSPGRIGHSDKHMSIERGKMEVMCQ